MGRMTTASEPRSKPGPVAKQRYDRPSLAKGPVLPIVTAQSDSVVSGAVSQ